MYGAQAYAAHEKNVLEWKAPVDSSAACKENSTLESRNECQMRSSGATPSTRDYYSVDRRTIVREYCMIVRAVSACLIAWALA